MATKIFFVHNQTQNRYEVVGMDKAKGMVTLKGELTTFDVEYDKDQFKAMGYTMERVEDDADDE
jgi:hypothetical protein